jgi:hypothetical protein
MNVQILIKFNNTCAMVLRARFAVLPECLTITRVFILAAVLLSLLVIFLLLLRSDFLVSSRASDGDLNSRWASLESFCFRFTRL